MFFALRPKRKKKDPIVSSGCVSKTSDTQSSGEVSSSLISSVTSTSTITTTTPTAKKTTTPSTNKNTTKILITATSAVSTTSTAATSNMTSKVTPLNTPLATKTTPASSISFPNLIAKTNSVTSVTFTNLNNSTKPLNINTNGNTKVAQVVNGKIIVSGSRTYLVSSTIASTSTLSRQLSNHTVSKLTSSLSVNQPTLVPSNVPLNKSSRTTISKHNFVSSTGNLATSNNNFVRAVPAPSIDVSKLKTVPKQAISLTREQNVATIIVKPSTSKRSDGQQIVSRTNPSLNLDSVIHNNSSKISNVSTASVVSVLKSTGQKLNVGTTLPVKRKNESVDVSAKKYLHTIHNNVLNTLQLPVKTRPDVNKFSVENMKISEQPCVFTSVSTKSSAQHPVHLHHSESWLAGKEADLSVEQRHAILSSHKRDSLKMSTDDFSSVKKITSPLKHPSFTLPSSYQQQKRTIATFDSQHLANHKLNNITEYSPSALDSTRLSAKSLPSNIRSGPSVSQTPSRHL